MILYNNRSESSDGSDSSDSSDRSDSGDKNNWLKYGKLKICDEQKKSLKKMRKTICELIFGDDNNFDKKKYVN